MTENTYEMVLKFGLVDWRNLRESLWNEVERDVENGNGVRDLIKMTTEIEQQLEKFEIADEQQRLETQIKDLEKRRNELRK